MKRNKNFDKPKEELSIKTILKASRTTGVINLANRKLSSIPSEFFDVNLLVEDVEWWKVADITKIDLSFNEVETIDEDFSVLGSLETVLIISNRLVEIPVSLFKLANLKVLELPSNRISYIPDEITQAASLVILNLEKNSITDLPAGFSILDKLEILNLTSNKLQEYPASLIKLAKLKKLSLSNNNINEIISSIGTLVSLEELIAQKCNISFIHQGFIHLGKLRFLDLSINKITSITLPSSQVLDSAILSYNSLLNVDNLSGAPSLTVLDLHNNKLTEVPRDIHFLTLLKTLTVSNNDINEIPYQIGFMKALVRINIEGNPLKRLNDKVRSGNAETIKKYLQTKAPLELDEEKYNLTVINGELKANKMNLKELPDLANFKGVSKIDLSENMLENVDFILKSELLCDTLEINMSSNKLKSIKEISKIAPIKTINLSNNQLTDFLQKQVDLGESNLFYSLTYLNLSRNNLYYVPSVLTKLVNLDALYLSFNSLTKIQLPLMGVLSHLDLSSNKITTMPEGLYEKLPNLRTFNLAYNSLNKLPTDLALMEKIQNLMLEGNPQKQIRYQVIEKGSAAVIDYLKSKHVFTPEQKESQVKDRVVRLTEIAKEIEEFEELMKFEKNFTKKSEYKRQKTELIKERSRLVSEL